LIPVIVCLASKLVAIDLAYHLRAGADMLSSHAIPSTDTYSFTAFGSRWVDQQWGAQVLLALFYKGGWGSIAVARAALVGATFGLTYAAARERGAAPRTASLLSIGGFIVALPALALRPQLFVLPLFALVMLLLVRRHRSPRALWSLPLIVVIWSNLHGSFFIPLLAIALTMLWELGKDRSMLRRLALVGAVCALATLCNPFGFGVWTYAWNIATDPVIRQTVTEWAPMDVASFAGVVFFASGLAVAGILARRDRPVAWVDLAWLGLFFALTLPARRSVVWWALVFPPVMAGILASRPDVDRIERADEGSPALNLAVIGVLLLTVIALLPWWRGTDPRSTLLEAPVDLADAARSAAPAGARVAVSQPWASWFEFANPDQLVMVDPRIEVFPQAVWDDYGQLRGPGPSWRSVLDDRQIDVVVADNRDWDLIPLLEADPGWRVAYRDADGVVFVRR
jgi:hypothetical protein